MDLSFYCVILCFQPRENNYEPIKLVSSNIITKFIV